LPEAEVETIFLCESGDSIGVRVRVSHYCCVAQGENGPDDSGYDSGLALAAEAAFSSFAVLLPFVLVLVLVYLLVGWFVKWGGVQS